MVFNDKLCVGLAVTMTSGTYVTATGTCVCSLVRGRRSARVLTLVRAESWTRWHPA